MTVYPGEHKWIIIATAMMIVVAVQVWVLWGGDGLVLLAALVAGRFAVKHLRPDEPSGGRTKP